MSVGSIPSGSSIATGQQIGGAKFSLFVDDAPFIVGLAKAESQARAASNKIGQQFGRGSNASMGLLYLGQAVDDVQYGFRAIVNNIPQMVMAFGGGAGLAGAIGIAAVAINQLTQHWDEILQLWGMGKTEREKEAMDELAKSVKEASDAYEKLKNAQPENVEKAVHASAKAFAGGAAEELAQALALAMRKEDPLIKGIRSAPGTTLRAGNPFFDKMLEEQKARHLKEAQMLVGGLGTNAANARIKQLMGLAPEAFNDAQRKALEQNSPEAMIKKQQQEQIKKNLKEEEEFQKRRMQQVKDQERATNEELSEEGKANAAVLEMERDRNVKELERQERNTKLEEQFLHKQIQNTQPSQLFTSGHAFASHMMTGALDSLGKEQVKQLQALNEKMTKLREEMAKQRGMRFR